MRRSPGLTRLRLCSGVTPLEPQLAAIRRDFGLLRGGLLYFPTAFWALGGSDAALLGLPLAGAAAAVVYAAGGPAAWP